MSLKSQFATNKSMEVSGIELDYGNDRIRMARAGGANKKFARMLELKTKPFRRAIQAGAMDNDRSIAILAEVYAHTVILGWQVNKGTWDNPKWEAGIDPSDAGDAGEKGTKLLPVTPENIMKVLRYLPDMFIDLQQQAQSGALYREELNEASAGNS